MRRALISGQPFADWVARGEGPPSMRVLVRPKAGILGPQGVVVERALPALGFEGVANVHVGRLEQRAGVWRLCRRTVGSRPREELVELAAA